MGSFASKVFKTIAAAALVFAIGAGFSLTAPVFAAATSWFCPIRFNAIVPNPNGNVPVFTQFKNRNSGITTMLSYSTTNNFVCGSGNIYFGDTFGKATFYTETIDCKSPKTLVFDGSSSATNYQILYGEIRDNYISTLQTAFGSAALTTGHYTLDGTNLTACPGNVNNPSNTAITGTVFSDGNLVQQTATPTTAPTDNVVQALYDTQSIINRNTVNISILGLGIIGIGFFIYIFEKLFRGVSK